MGTNSPSGVRLADLMGTLSLAVDLGLGQPMGHVVRSCALAARLAQRQPGGAGIVAEVVPVAWLGWLGCIADSRDAAKWFGDDIQYRAGVYDLDMRPLPFLGYMLDHAGAGDVPLRRGIKRAGILLDGGRSARDSLRAHCQVTSGVARRLGQPEEVCRALEQIFARWDGQGLPAGVSGVGIPLVIRLWQVADVAEVHERRGGPGAAVSVVRSRSGTQFDPEVVDRFCADAEQLLHGLPTGADWSFGVNLAPETYRGLTEGELDDALAVLADWVDLKSPWFSGHSRGVADLCKAAAAVLDLPEEEATRVRRAALVHDLGRAGVSNDVWDRAGALTGTQHERIRLHSYWTDRMLATSGALVDVGRIAAMAHERLDGSGYHRGLSAPALPATARLLAAADAFHTKLEPRPHRAALGVDDAAAHVTAEVVAGRLDKRSVEAVLAAAGRPHPDLPGPAGLTDREIEVLVLLARGKTNRQIAHDLFISPKTVGNHVEHIYAKADVTTRAGATMFAMEHSLVRS